MLFNLSHAYLSYLLC